MPDLSPIFRPLRAGFALLLCAALGPSCLLEFPERPLEAADALPPDNGGDIGTIAQDRFDWPFFAAHGLIADPDGRLRALFFTGRTGEDRRIWLDRVTLDDAVAEPVSAQILRSRGLGEFELHLPDVGPLKAAPVVLTRDDASGLGTVRLVGSPGWGGPIVLTRLAAVAEPPGVDGPYATRLVGIGGEAAAPMAAIGLASFGPSSFTLEKGVRLDGSLLPRSEGLEVDTPTGQFQINDPEWALRGAWLPAVRLFVAHRWNGISPDAVGGPLRPLAELWFGLPTPPDPIGPRTLAGRWQLAGLRVDDDRFSGFGASLFISSGIDGEVRFALRSDSGGVNHDGSVEVPSTEGLMFKDVVSLNPEDDTGEVWFAIGATEPPFLVLWGMSGQLPLPRLLFGLRQN